MNLKSTLISSALLMIICLFLFSASDSRAQVYCSPTFVSGCFSWRNQGITLDAVNWSIGSTSCSVSDYTADTAFLNAGTPYPMTVVNGDWCGCGVWVDFNVDGVFDTTENLFHLYTANATNNYNFNITIPANIPTGIYRMRVIAGWGTDCYSTSANGYGACGSYQYGNFDDFTVSVSGLPTGITADAENNLPLIELNPNPASSFVNVTVRNYKNHDAHLRLMDVTGKIICSFKVTKEKETLDISALSKGFYVLNYYDGVNWESLKVVK